MNKKRALLTLFTALSLPTIGHAAVIGPYTADANTLHLWHIDETGVPVADSTLGTAVPLTSLGSGAGSLGVASYPGFGNAYSSVLSSGSGIFALPPANSTSDNTATTTFWNQTTGAFTYEVIFRADFDPSAATEASEFISLITMDQDTGARPFTWYLSAVAGGGGYDRFSVMEMVRTVSAAVSCP